MAHPVIKPLLLKIVALTALASTAYTLTLLDQIVQGTLYSYGLQFSYNWANPYWTLLRVTWALLAVCATAVTVNTILIIRSGSKQKRLDVKTEPSQKTMKNTPSTMRIRERISATPTASLPQPSPKQPPKTPTPIIVPTPSPESPEIPSLFRCTHCGKAFTQPLRMLDFQREPPMIVNVCPFCNETMPSDPAVKESEQTVNKPFFKKSNDHIQESLTQ